MNNNYNNLKLIIIIVVQEILIDMIKWIRVEQIEIWDNKKILKHSNLE